MKFNKKQLIEQIKAIGQGLVDNASSMVTDVENIYTFNLYPVIYTKKEEISLFHY